MTKIEKLKFNISQSIAAQKLYDIKTDDNYIHRTDDVSMLTAQNKELQYTGTVKHIGTVRSGDDIKRMVAAKAFMKSKESGSRELCYCLCPNPTSW
jgi:hypothetical protein